MLLGKLSKKVSKFTRKSLTKLHDKPLAPPTKKQAELIEEFKTAFRQLQPAETANCSLSEREWLNNANGLRQLFIEEDPREFLRWHLVSSKMFVKYAGYTARELKYLQQRRDWASRWSGAIEEVQVGHPLPYFRYPKSSANLIHHAYHWAEFEEKTGLRISDIGTIFEFGGGYGNMCRLLHNLGFRGRYVIFDIPAFSLLQRFFLESAGIPTLGRNCAETDKSAVICVSDVEQLKEALSNRDRDACSVFTATWSISETSIDIRNLILPLTSSFDAFLISYQRSFQEMDNVAFFERWKGEHKNIEWHEWEIEHLVNNWYLFGRRRADCQSESRQSAFGNVTGITY